MEISKENKIAIILSLGILFISFFLTDIFQTYNMWSYMMQMHWQWQTKYYIFFILAVFSYIISYFLTSLYVKPIKESNERLKNYNHNLAHEVKTPMAVIKNNLELLDLEYDKELVKSSMEEIDNMKNITDSLLFLSENSSNFDIEKLSLYDLFKNYLDKIELSIKTDFIFNWNKILFDRLIFNLIQNAEKYWITWEKIKVFIDKDIFKVENQINENISITDTSKLFEAFYKLDTSRNTSWFWLWLSIVKKIIDLHNFKIKIEIKDNLFSVVVVK